MICLKSPSFWLSSHCPKDEPYFFKKEKQWWHFLLLWIISPNTYSLYKVDCTSVIWMHKALRTDGNLWAAWEHPRGTQGMALDTMNLWQSLSTCFIGSNHRAFSVQGEVNLCSLTKQNLPSLLSQLKSHALKGPTSWKSIFLVLNHFQPAWGAQLWNHFNSGFFLECQLSFLSHLTSNYQVSLQQIWVMGDAIPENETQWVTWSAKGHAEEL